MSYGQSVAWFREAAEQETGTAISMHWFCWPSSSTCPTSYRNVRSHPTPTSSVQQPRSNRSSAGILRGGRTLGEGIQSRTPPRRPAHEDHHQNIGHMSRNSARRLPRDGPAGRRFRRILASQPTRSTGCGFWRRDICPTLDSNGPSASYFCIHHCGSRICFMATSRKATTRSGPSRQLPGSPCSSPHQPTR